MQIKYDDYAILELFQIRDALSILLGKIDDAELQVTMDGVCKELERREQIGL